MAMRQHTISTGHDDAPAPGDGSGGSRGGTMSTLEARMIAVETKWDTVIPSLATRVDIVETRLEIASSAAGIRTDLQKVDASIRAEIKKVEAGIRTDLHKVEAGIRTDLHKVEAGIRADLQKVEAGIRADIYTFETGIRADVGRLEATIHKVDASIKTWMIGTFIAMFVAFGGLSFSMNNAYINAFKTQSALAAASAAPPAAINNPAPLPQAPALPAK